MACKYYVLAFWINYACFLFMYPHFLYFLYRIALHPYCGTHESFIQQQICVSLYAYITCMCVVQLCLGRYIYGCSKVNVHLYVCISLVHICPNTCSYAQLFYLFVHVNLQDTCGQVSIYMCSNSLRILVYRTRRDGQMS